MKNNIVDYIKNQGIIVVFDVDGVLAPYEWGNKRHCMSDEEWNNALASGENLYGKMRPVKTLQEFIKNKNTSEVYVCSKSADGEMQSKKKFCAVNYGIEPEYICFVKNKTDKLDFLNSLKSKLGIPESQIAIVEDTIETLDYIANNTEYITVHISSFL